MQFVIGLVIGFVIMFLALFPPLKASLSCGKPVGDLRVDHSDPTDRPYLFLEFDIGTDVNSIIRKKQVSFRVKREDFVPHE